MDTTRPPVDPDAFRDFERGAHDEIAEGYRDFFAAVTGIAIEPLLDAACVGAGSRLLDIASGPGDVAARAAERGATVVGVDLSPRMVAVAAERHPGIDFRLGDAEALAFPGQSFEAVVCNFGIGHFPRAERAVAEFARVLALGGRVAISWWDVPARHRLNGIFFDALAEVGASSPPELPVAPPMFRYSDDSELSALLRSAGLGEVAVSTVTALHRFERAGDLWDGILHGTVRTSIGIRRQPLAVQDRIRVVFDRLVQPYAQTGGELAVPVSIKIGSGRSRAASGS
jgi:SAM-dependent methyltransferase